MIFIIILIYISIFLKGVFASYNIIEFDPYILLFPIIVLRIISNIIRNEIKLNKPIIYFFLYISSIFISLIFNLDLNILSSTKGLLSYIIWPLIFVFSATERFTNKSSDRINKLMWYVGYITAINTIFPLILYLNTGIVIGELIIGDNNFRSFGFLTDQVGFALVYFVVLSVFEKRYISLLIFLFSIFVTGTRGAILFGLIALVVSFIFQNQKYLSFKNLFINAKKGVLLFFVLVAAWFAFGDALGELILLRLDQSSIENTSAQRLGAMEAGVQLFLENPLFGIGVGRFQETVSLTPELYSKFDYHETLSEVENMRGYSNAQNQFVDILVNGGVFSFISVYLFLFYALKTIQHNSNFEVNTYYNKISFIFIILSIFFIQTCIYLFNSGIISFLILILLGRGIAPNMAKNYSN